MQIKNVVMFIALILIIVIGVAVLWPNYANTQKLRASLAAQEKVVADQQHEIMQLRQEIDKLRKDTRAIERVAREKFGWCRENEKIYHFDSAGNLDTTTGASRP